VKYIYLFALAIFLASVSTASAQQSYSGIACKSQSAVENFVQARDAGVDITVAVALVNSLTVATGDDWKCRDVTVVLSSRRPVESINATNGFFAIEHMHVTGILDEKTGDTRRDGPQELYMARFFPLRGGDGL
jgi:hypothetical protein